MLRSPSSLLPRARNERLAAARSLAARRRRTQPTQHGAARTEKEPFWRRRGGVRASLRPGAQVRAFAVSPSSRRNPYSSPRLPYKSEYPRALYPSPSDAPAPPPVCVSPVHHLGVP
eukprot:601222-Prorocentrum_minimum.AAC.1